MKANLPSFGELLHSLRESEEEIPSIARNSQLYHQSWNRTPSPEWPAGNRDVSIVVSEATPDKRPMATGSASGVPTIPRRGRLARYQPYLTTGPVAARRSSLPGEGLQEAASRVESICSMKRRKSTVFEPAGQQQTRPQLPSVIPPAPPISSLLRRGGGNSPISPKSPTLPDSSPQLPMSLPTLPTFQFNKPTVVVVPPPQNMTSHRQQHSRDSSSGSMSSGVSASTDEGGMSFSSISGGSLSSVQSTPQKMRGRPYRVWTASGYRYPPTAP